MSQCLIELIETSEQQSYDTDEKLLVVRSLKAMPELPENAAILRERFSYVCLRKFYNCLNNPELYLTTDERINSFAIITWLEQTKTGDLNEVLHFSRSPILWKKTACEAGSCMGESCPHYKECYFQNAKKAAENSAVLFVPTPLFLQDMQMDYALLPQRAKIIFEGACKLPFFSRKTFGKHLNFYALRNAIRANIWEKKWEAAAETCEKQFLSLIKEIQNFVYTTKKRRFIYNQSLSSETGISCEAFQNSLKALLEIVEQENNKDAMQFSSDIRKISSDLAFFFAAAKNEFVYWIDNASNPHQLTFNAEPVNISVKWKSLYQHLKSAVFTDSVLSINGQFDYIINRLGLYGKNAKTKIVENKDLKTETFAAEFLPKPTDENFGAELTKTLHEIISKNKTNTIIFSDQSSLAKLRTEVKNDETLKDKICFFQGEDGNFFNLSTHLQKETCSVLAGYPDELKLLEDMDLPENSLIVISRLPFPDLKEPVLARQMEMLKEQNKNGFVLVTMPETFLTLRRAFNAIVRQGKKQTLLLLDSRITSEPYGQKIQKLFPDLKVLSHRVFSTGFFDV